MKIKQFEIVDVLFFCLMVAIGLLLIAAACSAQEIAYCKNMAGDIVTIAKGSPCPQGYYPL